MASWLRGGGGEVIEPSTCLSVCGDHALGLCPGAPGPALLHPASWSAHSGTDTEAGTRSTWTVATVELVVVVVRLTGNGLGEEVGGQVATGRGSAPASAVGWKVCTFILKLASGTRVFRRFCLPSKKPPFASPQENPKVVGVFRLFVFVVHYTFTC